MGFARLIGFLSGQTFFRALNCLVIGGGTFGFLMAMDISIVLAAGYLALQSSSSYFIRQCVRS